MNIKRKDYFITDADIGVYQIINFFNDYKVSVSKNQNNNYDFIYPTMIGNKLEVQKIEIAENNFFDYFLSVANSKEVLQSETSFSYEDLKMATDLNYVDGKYNRQTLATSVDSFMKMLAEIKEFSVENKKIMFGYYIDNNYYQIVITNTDSHFADNISTYFKVRKWQEKQLKLNKKISKIEFVDEKASFKVKMLREMNMAITNLSVYGKERTKQLKNEVKANTNATLSATKDLLLEIGDLVKKLPEKINEKKQERNYK